MPLVVIEEPNHTEPLLDALLEAGLNLIEIALRTPRAIEAVEIAARRADMTVAAGTVLTAEQLQQVIQAGADFAVSPCFTTELSEAASNSGFPFIPGIASTSEAMTARNQGFSYLKIYPAEPLGGSRFVQSLSAVFQDLSFMPSGGVSQKNFLDYLSQHNVFAVSGSWIAPKDLISSGRFDQITRRAKHAKEHAT